MRNGILYTLLMWMGLLPLCCDSPPKESSSGGADLAWAVTVGAGAADSAAIKRIRKKGPSPHRPTPTTSWSRTASADRRNCEPRNLFRSIAQFYKAHFLAVSPEKSPGLLQVVLQQIGSRRSPQSNRLLVSILWQWGVVLRRHSVRRFHWLHLPGSCWSLEGKPARINPMTAKLSDELVRELELVGDRPLQVVNPRYDRRYLIIAEDRLIVGGIEGPQNAGDSDWTEEKNTRRFELIDLEIAGTLSTEGVIELRRLEREVDEYLRRMAPLPIAATRDLHERLRRSLNDSPAP